MNISNFIKENIPLCVSILGTAIVGYMGYHAVRWINNKCRKTEEIDQIGQKHLRVSDLDSTEGKVKTGQGEYIVFHSFPGGEKKEVARATYEQVYKILNDYAPAAIINRNSDTAIEECDNRFEIIKSKIKEIDPSLELMFVPRTLYELIFIRECIKEDLNCNEICPELSQRGDRDLTVKFSQVDQQQFEPYQKERKKILEDRKCWHLCYFDDVGNNDHPEVQDVAYRLNHVVAEALSPTVSGLTHEEFARQAEKEITFLKAHYQNCLEEGEKDRKGIKVHQICSSSTPGPTTNFGYESNRGAIRPMGIRDDKDAQIIRNALAIDCSEVAQRAFILYRGADFQKDSANRWSNKDEPYSLSFGSSLFAGSLYDGGATAFYYMRNGQNAYAIPVPFDQLNSSPFFVPPTNTVAQLFGDGEIFHARTKAWKDYDVERGLAGISYLGVNPRKRDHLKSELTKDELITQFQKYKNQAIQLKQATGLCDETPGFLKRLFAMIVADNP